MAFVYFLGAVDEGYARFLSTLKVPCIGDIAHLCHPLFLRWERYYGRIPVKIGSRSKPGSTSVIVICVSTLPFGLACPFPC